MNLTYLGAFRCPQDVGFNYSRGPMTLDLHRREVVLFSNTRRVGRLALVRPQIPRYLTTGDTTLLDRSTVPVAPFVPDSLMVDPTNNTWSHIFKNDAGEGTPEGVQVIGDHALFTGSIYYDADASQDRSVIMTEWPITAARLPAQTTPWRSVKGVGEGWAAGPITIIPEKWRAAFKGDVLVGQPGGLPIITRQSFGPCAIALKARDVLEVEDVDATLLLGYREGQGWPWNGPANDFWNSATQYNSITFIGDSVVFLGRHGYGDACYGTGGVGGECFDPANNNKGTHAFPYRVQGISYACQELADVVAGKLKPHQPKPFWFPLPFPIFEHPHYKLSLGTIPAVDVIGADYDSATGELYVGVAAQDSYGYEPGPLVHVFQTDIARTPLERPLFTVTPDLPDPTTPLEDEVMRLRGELEETRVHLDIVEGQRIQLATKLQAVLGAVRAITDNFEKSRTL